MHPCMLLQLLQQSRKEMEERLAAQNSAFRASLGERPVVSKQKASSRGSVREKLGALRQQLVQQEEEKHRALRQQQRQQRRQQQPAAE